MDITTEPIRNCDLSVPLNAGAETASWPCGNTTLIAELRAENERLRAGIEQIRDASGMACAEMETCSHKGCNGSISAHLLALAILT